MTSKVRKALRRTIAAVAALASLMSVAACGGTSSSTAQDGTVVSIFNGTTGTFNENFNPFSPTALGPTLGVIYETLYWYNLAADEDPTPMLATGYEWNEDGSELTITTREGVKWHDGEPFSAADVAFTFNLIHDTPALNTNGTACTAKLIDENHVKLIFPTKNADGTPFDEPFKGAYMQEGGILGGQAIVPEHIWKNVKDPMNYTNANPIGTGAFKLSRFTNQSYSFSAFKDYWNGAPKIDGVRYIALNDASAATSTLMAGQVDWMSAYIPSYQMLLKNYPRISAVNTPRLTTVVMTCSNTEAGCKGPQTDTAVRQAMYYGMNRTQLNKLAGAGAGAIGSPTMLMPDRDRKWITDKNLVTTPETEDQEKAKQILEDAGWKMGDDGYRHKDGVKLSMTIQTVAGWSDYILINDTLKQQMKPLGIEIISTQMAWNQWNENEQKGNYQLSLDSLGLGVTADPYYTYNPRYSSLQMAEVGETSGGQNYARYSNPKVDDAIEAAAGTEDEAERKAQYAIVQKEIANDVPYIPVYINSMLTEFNDSKVTGWPTEDNMYALPAAWKAWDMGIILQHLEPKQ
ncbi:ABC transporter substrate-binding protein [Bifidobacterium rousetti]|uniref:ABC transporter substrate-binding protein n=1 Tax=Bifidobacterium rousetti TaxID=2045439 RepID=UPI00123B2F93|nr:ABC transporter substrate-binding protein [Bifidobacterium rousetti]KAA8818677.1 ABC transporter substrate-binding protein [Bifidobacterium rousetti]